jgi:hypothetical protein
MQNDGSTGAQIHNQDAERDRFLNVLMLEYGTLRAEILVRLSARYQFVGFVTTAAALIGVAIGYSSGIKVWLLAAVSVAVIGVGFYGYYRMAVQNRGISARVAAIEGRINTLVPAEPGGQSLLSWESEHQGEAAFSPLRDDYRRIKLRMGSARARSARSKT